MISRRFIAFLAAGAAAACLNWSSRFLFSLFAPFEVAVVLAFMVGLVSAFVLNRLLVFAGSAAPAHVQFGRFVTVNLGVLAVVLGISVGLERLLFPAIGFDFYSEAIAHGIGVVSPVFISYLLHKHWTFAPGRGAPPGQGAETR